MQTQLTEVGLQEGGGGADSCGLWGLNAGTMLVTLGLMYHVMYLTVPAAADLVLQ